MARQRITPISYAKSFEAYMDFSNGLNSEVTDERLANSEFPVFDNVDLGVRSSARKRMGRTNYYTVPGTKPQGMQYYFRNSDEVPDVVYASNGKIYISIDGSQTPFQVPIYTQAGVSLSFQTSKQIEMAQYYNRLYLATGTEFCQLAYAGTDEIPEYDSSVYYTYNQYIQNAGKVYMCIREGTSSAAPTHTSETTGIFRFISVITSGYFASVVPSYAPDSLEFMALGSNTLAVPNENTTIRFSDEIGFANTILAIYPKKSQIIANENVTFKAYVTYKSTLSLSDLRYKWEYKLDSASEWTVLSHFLSDSSNKEQEIKFSKAGKYEVRCSLKSTETNSPTNVFILPEIIVLAVEKKVTAANTIRQATKIVVYENRILLAGDSDDPYNMYISHLDNPGYFPYAYRIPFDRVRREPITAIVKYRNYIVVFTKTTISSFSGSSEQDFSVALIHEGIGCIAPRSAQVVGNNIFFLSQEGIYQLRPNQYINEIFNVSRLDNQIKSSIYPDPDACAMVYDSQYFICFPSLKVMYRYYYEQNAWVRDKSEALTAVQMGYYTNFVREFASNGVVYLHNDTIYDKVQPWQSQAVFTTGSYIVNHLNETIYYAVTGGTTSEIPPSHTSGIQFDGTVEWSAITQLYADGSHSYAFTVQSKYLDLSMAFNNKKLKKIYVLARHYESSVNLGVKVEADSQIILTPDTSEPVINTNGYVTWNVKTSPNMHFYAGTSLGAWILGTSNLGKVEVSVQRASISGKARRVRVTFVHDENRPCEIYGFGLEFKEKKV